MGGEPIDFNSVVSEPIDLVKYHPEKNFLIVFPPPPLHCGTLTFNIFYGYLRTLCIEIAMKWVKLVGVKPSPIHGDSDFPGNECWKLLKSAHKLRQLTPTSENLSKFKTDDDANLKHFSRVFEIVHQLASCLDSFKSIIDRVMTPKLSDNWLEAFEQFAADFQIFSEGYLKFHPRNKNQSLTPPKIHVVLNEMIEWITLHKCSLYRVNEQAFETVHSHYADFEQNFSVDKSGFVSDLKQSDSSSSSSYHPSHGTRSGAQSKRKRQESVNKAQKVKRERLLATLLSSTHSPSSSSSSSSFSSSSGLCSPPRSHPLHGRYKQSQKKRRHAIAAYAGRKFFEKKSRERLRYCADRQHGTKTGVAPWNKRK